MPDLGPDDLLFPVSGNVPSGTERKIHKMMRLDLERARTKWIEEAGDEPERHRRDQSDFLSYCNGDGLFADFHSNRHLFITSLEQVGLSPKMAQTLARHSDIRLTLGTYTHVGIHDQTAAIESLPAPPGRRPQPENTVAKLRATAVRMGLWRGRIRRGRRSSTSRRRRSPTSRSSCRGAPPLRSVAQRS